MAEYELRLTEQHLVESLTRCRRHRRARLWLSPLKVVAFLGLGALFVVSAYRIMVAPCLIFGLLLILLALGPRLDYWLLKRRFRKSPFYNGETRTSVSPSGFVSTGPKSRVELSWSAFTKAYRLPDGFLVFMGPTQFQWWPDASLKSGSVPEVDRLLREKVSGYRGV